MTVTGAGAACACPSVIIVRVVPARTTPPRARPACTARVSLTSLTTVPVGRLRSAFSLTVADALFVEMTVVKRPGSVPGIVTMT
jgi:hypothetical protein